MEKPLPGTVLLIYQQHAALAKVTWSPNSRYIASGGFDNRVHVWESAHGVALFIHPEEAFALDVNDMNRSGLSWSPDGRRIVFGNTNHGAQILDALSGTVLLTKEGPYQRRFMRDASWSPDNKIIVSLIGDVIVWDASTGSTLLTYHGHKPLIFTGRYAVAWSPDGKRIASGSSDQVSLCVWVAKTGDTDFVYEGDFSSVKRLWYGTRHDYGPVGALADEEGVHAVAWSPNGRYLASAGPNKLVHIIDALTGLPLLVYRKHVGIVSSVSWSPDSKYLASAGYDKTVQIWEALTGSTLFTYRGHTAIVRAVAWSPDGSRIASGSDDSTVQIWQAASTGVKVPPPPKEKPSTTSLDWGDLVSKVFDKIAGAASILALLDAVERRWRERSIPNDTHPHQVASQPSETDIMAIRLRMTHGPDHQFEEWLTDPDKLKHYIDVFNQPSSSILPLKAIFVQRNDKELSVDVLKGTQNNPQLDELLSYLNINSEQK